MLEMTFIFLQGVILFVSIQKHLSITNNEIINHSNIRFWRGKGNVDEELV